ncbi:MAG: metal-dependent hydrolase [bacterium]|nr:metal-dependent hydrolase [bacterium]MCM1374531.1 metal-dependent hydrolase [Muribaculum sp.]
MMATTHRLGGIAVGATAAALLHTNTAGTLILITGALVGSIFPDIDNKKSTISRKMLITALVVSAGRHLINAVTASFPKEQKQYVKLLIGHRGFTHSLIGSTILPVFVILIGLLLKLKARYLMLAGLGIFSGCLSHLFLDMLSGGVPLFMPFSTDLLIVARIKTGSSMERIFRVCLALVLLFSLIGK